MHFEGCRRNACSLFYIHLAGLGLKSGILKCKKYLKNIKILLAKDET
jgi:hypothetical protein